MVDIARDSEGRLFVIDGDSEKGWFVYRVATQPLARYDSLAFAKDAIYDGDFEPGWV